MKPWAGGRPDRAREIFARFTGPDSGVRSAPRGAGATAGARSKACTRTASPLRSKSFSHPFREGRTRFRRARVFSRSEFGIGRSPVEDSTRSSLRLRTPPVLLTPQSISINGRYHKPRNPHVTATAKLFMHGRSQAVRLPKEFRLPGKQSGSTKLATRVILEPLEKAPFDVAAWRAELDRRRRRERSCPKVCLKTALDARTTTFRSTIPPCSASTRMSSSSRSTNASRRSSSGFTASLQQGRPCSSRPS